MAGPYILDAYGDILPPKCDVVTLWGNTVDKCGEPADYVIEMEDGQCFYFCGMHLRVRSKGFEGIKDITDVKMPEGYKHGRNHAHPVRT